MKKEDLCMLLIVVALVLIISRNTKIFEGFTVNDLPDIMSESDKKTIMDMVASGEISVEELQQELGLGPKPAKPPTPPKPGRPPKVAKPPTPPKPSMPPVKPPTPPKPAMPPVKPPTPPKPAMPPAKPPTPPKPAVPPTPKPSAPPSKPDIAPSFPTPMEQVDGPTPFGTPLSDDKSGAFGQGFVLAFDRAIDLYAGPDQDMNVIIPSTMAEESLTKKFLGSLQPQIMQNLDEVRTVGSVAGADFQPYDPTSISGTLLDNQFKGLQAGLPTPTPQQPSQPVAPPTNMGMDVPPSAKLMVPPTAPMGGGSGVEVHFVFGEWCGHSRNAKPEFQNLVSRSDVKTANGMPVKFVMTEDTSPAMEKFKSSVQGFPTYMMVKPNGQMEELVGHNRTADSIVSMVQGKSV